VPIAALYDIHGNLPALTAVLSEVEREGEATKVLVGGDVLWGPMQSECLAALDGVGAVCIAGNCERDVLDPVSETDRWCRSRLEGGDRERVAAWPGRAELEVDGLGSVLFCHATPLDVEGIITAETPAAAVESAIASVSADVVVCGHTHVQFDRRMPSGTRIVNPGSVGLPYENAVGAYWALLGPGVELRHTVYDAEGALTTFATTAFGGRDASGDWFDGVFERSLRAEISPAEATAFFERRRLGLPA
jgi:predicted phosphodiesterase